MAAPSHIHAPAFTCNTTSNFDSAMFRLSFLRSMFGVVFRLLQMTLALFFQSVLAACVWFGTLAKEWAIGG
jgi:hypothetical protein